jgi:hypothetical protein
MFTSLFAISFLILPWLVVNAPQLVGSHLNAALSGYALLASVLFAVGGVYLGMVTMRAEVFPRWAGLLIAVGAVLNLVVFFLAGITASIVGLLSTVLFALGLGWIGYTLWTAKVETLQQTVLTP